VCWTYIAFGALIELFGMNCFDFDACFENPALSCGAAFCFWGCCCSVFSFEEGVVLV